MFVTVCPIGFLHNYLVHFLVLILLLVRGGCLAAASVLWPFKSAAAQCDERSGVMENIVHRATKTLENMDGQGQQTKGTKTKPKKA
jgi:hypothetical protein